MNIGFDAKRAFHNNTGLGNYSRTLIQSLALFYPKNSYYLFNPKKNNSLFNTTSNCVEINPSSFLSKLFPSIWRSKWLAKELDSKVTIYHGLSNELPIGITNSKVKKVVTIHDLIFEHYPEQYKKSDVVIYRKKFKYACQYADCIIAISEATKQDIINLYKIEAFKIKVCYQSCDQRFFTESNELKKLEIKKKYNLQTPYFISVGSIIERKNLLNVCKSFVEFRKHHTAQLVVIGKGSSYKQIVIHFLKSTNCLKDVLFLEDQFESKDIFKDLPILYQNAIALVYPSKMEGFGIPVIEAMATGCAVITSNRSSLIEAGGDAAIQCNPDDLNELQKALEQVFTNHELRGLMISKGRNHVQQFTNQKTSEALMTIYKTLI